ncbi:MAG: 50S ribosomal protein L22 [Candidatus Delongbacteria bacterium]|jgi:large subunit ribosomal protein L22|nr:50S ribosomal protein L22 [Candidatus Delongbacteria bacterium]
MEAYAKAKWVGYPVNKVRLVLDLIKEKDVESAVTILKFTPNFAAMPIAKTLKSAVANLIDTNRDVAIDTSNVFIAEMYADEGPTMKRFKPRAQGRATKIRKRTSHIFINVSTKE